MEAEKAEKRYGKCGVPGTLIYGPGADSLYELKFTAVPGMALNCPTIQPKTGPKFLGVGAYFYPPCQWYPQRLGH
jgi:hypothetical protein